MYGEKQVSQGRKPGSKNKATKQIKEAFALLVENNLSQLKLDIAKLEPKDRINAILNIARYILPTLRSQELEIATNNDGNFELINAIYNASEETIKQVIDEQAK